MTKLADDPMDDKARQAASSRLEAVFQAIWHNRMMDVPILHPKLKIAVVGMQRWNGYWLAILVTPWCMNIMILPEAPARWPCGNQGDSVSHDLPGGRFSFILGEEPDLGPFQMCSLFSPMLEFTDHAAAVATAEAAMRELMTPPAPPVAQWSRRDLLKRRTSAGQAAER